MQNLELNKFEPTNIELKHVKFKTLKLIAMICCMIAMIAIPVSTIVRWNTARAYGTEFKFKCRLLDPLDYLRGRYVALSFDNNVSLAEPFENYNDIEKVYVTILSKNGYAEFDKVYTTPPKSGTYIVTTKPSWWYQDESNRVRIDVPFERYYMNEKKAPIADQMLRDNINEERDVYLTVKIYNQIVSPTGLFIDGKPIEEFVDSKVREID